MADNIQLLRRSAEDAKRDAKQWAASSGGDAELAAEGGEGDAADVDVDASAPSIFRSDKVGTLARLIDVVRGGLGQHQVTVGSSELARMAQQLGRFQDHADWSADGASAADVDGLYPTPLVTKEALTGAPSQAQLRSIKGQQISASKEVEQRIQGIQYTGASEDNALALTGATGHSVAVGDILIGFGDDVVDVAATDLALAEAPFLVGPEARVELGPSTSFIVLGKQLAVRHTLNGRQTIALLLLC